MTRTVGLWRGTCADCGGPVTGFADPRAGSVADVPEAGEAALCLACLCFGTEGEALAGVPLPVKRELAEAQAVL